MRFLCTAAIGLFALTATTFADPAADAEKLVTIAFSSSALEAAKAAFAPFLEQARKQGIPEEGLKEISAAAEVFFNKTFNDPDLHKEIVKLYQDSYTPEELQAILAFYATPAGQKTLTTMPVISQKATGMGQKYAAKNQEAFQGELRSIFQRYQKPAAGAPPAEAKPDAAPAAPAPPAPAPAPEKK